MKLVIALFLVLLSATPALASSVLFVPDAGTVCGAPNVAGSVDVILPLDKLGKFALPRGQVSIHGNQATVSIIPEWQFDRKNVLVGTVLDTRTVTDRRDSRVEGTLLFNEGSWLRYFDDQIATETISLQSGDVSGRIISVSNGDLIVKTIGGETLVTPLANVADIQSPRVFRFQIPIALVPPMRPNEAVIVPAYRVVLNPAEAPLHARALKAQIAMLSRDGDTPTSHLVLLGTALSIANLSQALAPILVPTVAGPPLRRAAFFTEYPFNLLNSGFTTFVH